MIHQDSLKLALESSNLRITGELSLISGYILGECFINYIAMGS